VQLPIKLWASSVTSTLRLLKSEPAGNYAKDLESFKSGEQTRKQATQTKKNSKQQQTRTPRKIPE